MTAQILRPVWSARAGVHAAFTWRQGGVSAAPWAALNLGGHVGDDAHAVAENRRRVSAALRLPGEPIWLNQVHGTRVYDVDAQGEGRVSADHAAAGAPIADAAVTRQPGTVLAILVADCLPVLLASRSGEAVAAAHAGWRGLAAGVLEATVSALRVPPEHLCAWLGPAIGARRFVVGEEVRAAFVDRDRHGAQAFRALAGASDADAGADAGGGAGREGRTRWLCDLELLARQRLRVLGVGAQSSAGVCTYEDAARCFSYRRDGRTGRMAALIWRE